MANYQHLWTYLAAQDADQLQLSFEEIAELAGVALNHSFLNEKKNLEPYGWTVQKISMKQQSVLFVRRSPRG